MKVRKSSVAVMQHDRRVTSMEQIARQGPIVVVRFDRDAHECVALGIEE
jgi:hypothetical protein